MPYFVVVNEQGAGWIDSRSMREQEQWGEHATFVNSLVAEGRIVLGGPLGTGRPHRALLIVRFETAALARARLLEDPWMRAGLLQIRSIDPFQVLASDDRLDRVLAEIAPPSG
jgi:uncharacterized protein YciI